MSPSSFIKRPPAIPLRLAAVYFIDIAGPDNGEGEGVVFEPADGVLENGDVSAVDRRNGFDEAETAGGDCAGGAESDGIGVCEGACTDVGRPPGVKARDSEMPMPDDWLRWSIALACDTLEDVGVVIDDRLACPNEPGESVRDPGVGKGAVAVKDGNKVEDSVLSPCGVSSAVASSPSSPSKSPTASPSNRLTHPSCASIGAHRTSPSALSFPLPKRGISWSQLALLGDGMGEDARRTAAGTSTSRLTSGNGEVGGNKSARASSNICAGVEFDPLGVICAKDAKVGVDASPRSPDSSSLPSEYPLRPPRPAASHLPGSTAIPMTMSGNIVNRSKLSGYRCFAGGAAGYDRCTWPPVVAPPFDILVDPDGGKKRNRLSAPNAPRLCDGSAPPPEAEGNGCRSSSERRLVCRRIRVDQWV